MPFVLIFVHGLVWGSWLSRKLNWLGGLYFLHISWLGNLWRDLDEEDKPSRVSEEWQTCNYVETQGILGQNNRHYVCRNTAQITVKKPIWPNNDRKSYLSYWHLSVLSSTSICLTNDFRWTTLSSCYFWLFNFYLNGTLGVGCESSL